MAYLVFLVLVFSGGDAAAFGDSITVGGLSGRQDKSYIRLLENDFGPIDNRAVNGSSTASQVYQIDTYTGSATTYFWMPGFNDMRAGIISLEEYEYWLRRGLDIATARGVRVYLGACLPMTEEGYRLRGGSPERVEAFNEVAARVAGEYDNVIFIPFPDYDPAIHTRADLMHPNDAGHRVIYQAYRQRANRLYLPVVGNQKRPVARPLCC